MAVRRNVTLAMLLLLVVTLLTHMASQDSATVGAVGVTPTAGAAVSAPLSLHAAAFADPEHGDRLAADPAGAVPPSCPDDRRSVHESPGTLSSRFSAGTVVVVEPALVSVSARCADMSVPDEADRSEPVAAVSGVALCTELCVSRR
ncbi:hypothetical protein [Pseudonocardia dioxanivorans]|uniref:Uncharacterized protein n=1 Tax=Pseudonocardia dioxanivorans (strain ATCC 55486 / DSM 44775 / JCM 13855 / CB1190) TaxID=675635 RepID=F4CXE9_PSEUX|nr:hypothetical protein [Pseudonocardia dioxanivorans]AEA26523.1 hypothetical protein Psed_4365 [Pseudonocardia dioxanivorans CB1190]